MMGYKRLEKHGLGILLVLFVFAACCVSCSWDSELHEYTGEICYAASLCSSGVEPCKDVDVVFKVLDSSQSSMDKDEVEDLVDALGFGRCKRGYSCVNVSDGVDTRQYCEVSCPPNQVFCAVEGVYACVDVNVDILHCGECHSPCPMGSRCEKGECKQNCADGYILCGDGDERRCVDPLTDLEFCGAQNECVGNDVGVECAEGMLCSGGVCAATCAKPYVQCSREGRTYCADFSRDLENCGSCGNVCDDDTVPNGKSFICVGVCEAKTCIDGYYVYDGKCEQNTTIDCGHRGNNCGFLAGWANGECTNEGLCVATECKVGYRLDNGVCQTENNECCGNECMVCAANTMCSEGECSESCSAGLTPCGEGSSAYCANIKSDTANCTECGSVCDTTVVSNSTAVYCDNGCKAASCETGYYLDNGECFANTIENCAFKGNHCNVLNADNYCENERCRHTCKAGFHPTANGTCVADSPEHCGAEGNNCGLLAGWQAGSCTNANCVATNCIAGYHVENQDCVADTNSCCGASCAKCAANQVCDKGACSSTCTDELSACGTGTDAYCANLSRDLANCSKCGEACNTSKVPHSTAVYCDNGCKAAGCQSGYYLHNGACHPNDASNCGVLGVSCNIANGVGQCVSGKCKYSCNENFHLYNSDTCEENSLDNCGMHEHNCLQNEGWETATCTTDGKCIATACKNGYYLSNQKCIADSNACCGSACMACGSGTVCSEGLCKNACSAGLTYCTSGCFDTSTNVNHCGDCNSLCNVSKVPGSSAVYCEATRCKASACSAGHYLTNGECKAYDLNNCGAADYKCSNLTGWEAGTCTSGACVATSCKTGYYLIDGVCRADSNSCCGSTCETCGTGTVCSNGECLANCGAGLELCGDKCVNLASSIEHCGACDASCTTDTVPDSNSVYCDSVCKASACNSGYYLSNGECKAYDLNNCGAADYKCSNLTGWEAGTCTSGAC
ncbi:MAG: hypothetical protein WC966_12445, partial [Bradymonadales bacterium]